MIAPSAVVAVAAVAMSLTARSTEVQLRRAAGSKCHETFLAAVKGWTAHEIDSMAGKNPVHMAAWRGDLQNLKYLIEDMKCNINVVSTGEFSFGKTPIFFALTQSKESLVLYLLDHQKRQQRSDEIDGAANATATIEPSSDCCCQVKIVNNKGQSPLSIASSHLSKVAIERIQHHEEQQQHIPWINYRTTHSDGNEYGDLDPRFMDRDIREYDNVTALAINPTTKEIRKGNIKRYPQYRFTNHPRRFEKVDQKEEQLARQRKISPFKFEPLSPHDTLQLKNAWERLQQCYSDETNSTLSCEATENSSNEEVSAVVDIALLLNKQKSQWIPDTAIRLKNMGCSPDVVTAATMELSQRKSTIVVDDVNGTTISGDKMKLVRLMQRLEVRLRSNDPKQPLLDNVRSKSITSCLSIKDLLSQPVWFEARDLVADLSLESLLPTTTETCNIVCLPCKPVWVDTVTTMLTLNESLEDAVLVPFDVEWETSTTASTFQVAIGVQSYVIDLFHEDNDFQDVCKRSILAWFRTKTMLGFSFSNDIDLMNAHLRTGGGSRQLCLDKCLDLQQLWQCSDSRTVGYIPGLAACTAECHPKAVLEKEYQCSDWGQRPLSSGQLHYAGLDAAILPYLLAEKVRRHR